MQLKIRKTAGVRVTRSVYASIVAGNAARDRVDHPAAIAAYRTALSADPSLTHIWVQLGHMLKDSGDLEGATGAYERAVAAPGPQSADTFNHLGHLARRRGRPAEAMRHFAEAALRDPSATAPLHEIAELLPTQARGNAGPSDIRRLLFDLRHELKATASQPDAAHPEVAGGAAPLVLDCTSLIELVAGGGEMHRAVRRQIGLIDAAIAIAGHRVHLAYTLPNSGSWIALPPSTYRELLTHRPDAAEPGGPAGNYAARLLLLSAMQDPFVFPANSWLVELGPPANAADHFLPVAHARNHGGARYAAIVDDLEPVTLPQFTSEARRVVMVSWMADLFHLADVILAASPKIADDLGKLAAAAGIGQVGERIALVDLSLPRVATASMPPQHAPVMQPYVLVVGDVSGVKGHLVALDAWVSLINRLGDGVPDLVLVGDATEAGASPIVQRIRSNSALARKVRWEGDVGVDALAALYDGAAMALCPTLYEGDASVLEDARARGTPVIASDLPVLREAHPAATFVPAGDAEALEAAIQRQLASGTTERRPASDGSAKSPEDVFQGILSALDRGATVASQVQPFCAVPGRWHAFTPLNATELKTGLGTGAAFRSDAGWLPPLSAGCWTRPGGGEIAIGLAPGERWRLTIQLLGLPAKGTRWSLDVEGRDSLTGSIDAGCRQWVVLDELEAPDGRIRLFLQGSTNDHIDIPNQAGQAPGGMGSLGVAGFHMCRQDDWLARDTLIETVTLGSLYSISAYA